MTVSFAVVASVLQETVGEVSTEQKEKLEHKRRMRENRKKERKKERRTSTLMPAKRLPMVPVDSSAARMPLPGAEMARAVATSSAM